MRRSPGHGSIKQLPSGRWRVRVTTAEGRRIGGVEDTPEAADALRRALLGELLAAAQAPTGSMTLAAFGDRLFREREAEGLTSVRNERSVWANRVHGAALGALPLATVTRDAVRAWLADQRASTVKRRSKRGRVWDTGKPIELETLKRYRAIVHGVLQAAHEKGLIPANPAHKLRLVGVERGKKHAPRWTYLAPAEIEQVLASDAIPARFRLLYQVAIYTGLRRGELWALRWGDVALEGARPEVHVQRSNDGATKSGRDRRVPLLAPARVALRRLWMLAKQPGPEALVFPTSKGRQRARNDRGQWGRNGAHAGYCRAAGVARRVPFHALRHTCATALVSGFWGPAWKLEAVRDFLGHSSIKVTERYAHLSPDYLHAKAAETALPSPEDTPAPVRVLPPRPPTDTAGEALETTGENRALCSSTRNTASGVTSENHASSSAPCPSEVLPEGGSGPRAAWVVSLAPARALADALVWAVARGEPHAPVTAALVALVLGCAAHPLRERALAVGGEFVTHRALDLAEAVTALARAEATPLPSPAAARRGDR